MDLVVLEEIKRLKYRYLRCVDTKDWPGLADTLFARIAGVSKRQDGYIARVDYGCANPGQGIPATISTGDCVLSNHPAMAAIASVA